MLKILWKRGKIAPEEQFLPLSTIFYYLMLDFYVKTGIRFSLRDKRLFEITEVEITRVDCTFKCMRVPPHFVLLSLQLYHPCQKLQTEKYSRLSLSRNRRDPQNQFEISVLRHIRFVVLRKKQFEKPIFTND